MKITDELIRHIAALARLKYDSAELERFRSQFGRIVEYVERMNELEFEGVEPTSHPVERSNVLRKDEIKPSLDRERALMNAPAKTDDGFVVVPKVIEGS